MESRCFKQQGCDLYGFVGSIAAEAENMEIVFLYKQMGVGDGEAIARSEIYVKSGC